jgi:hypothetical protein
MRIDETRSPMNEAWVNQYNKAQLDIARRNPTRVDLIDLNQYLDPDGTWTDTVAGIKVRTFDRSHLSDEGADYVAAWLAPQLLGLHVNASPAAGPKANTAASVGARDAVDSLPPQPAFVAQRS